MPHDWPALILGLILLTYWGRVLRMARKARRRGLPANVIPAEPLGRVLRLLWIPIVIIWVAHPFITATKGSPPGVLTPLYHGMLVSWLAVAVAAAALAGSLICWKRMGRSWRMGIDPQETTSLITTGPYARVRHPIYALSTLLMLATMAAIPSPLMLGTGAAHLLLLQWEARREERYLLSLHGEAYRGYASQVPRFIPRPICRRPPASGAGAAS